MLYICDILYHLKSLNTPNLSNPHQPTQTLRRQVGHLRTEREKLAAANRAGTTPLPSAALLNINSI